MVSSAVYRIGELLENIYATLTTFGYNVWMSHKGTLPVSSTGQARQVLTKDKVQTLVDAMAQFAEPTSAVLPADYQAVLNPVIAAAWA